MTPQEIGYLCDECAVKLGWRWPEVHCATYHSGICGVCKEKRSLCCYSDWLQGDMKKIPAELWD